MIYVCYLKLIQLELAGYMLALMTYLIIQKEKVLAKKLGPACGALVFHGTVVEDN
jgi:hypothetical protein